MTLSANGAIALMALSIVFGIFVFGIGFIAGWNLRDRQVCDHDRQPI